MLDRKGDNFWLRTLAYALYWSQFSVDFIIYVRSNKQYREAYIMLIRDMCCCCCIAQDDNGGIALNDIAVG